MDPKHLQWSDQVYMAHGWTKEHFNLWGIPFEMAMCHVNLDHPSQANYLHVMPVVGPDSVLCHEHAAPRSYLHLESHNHWASACCPAGDYRSTSSTSDSLAHHSLSHKMPENEEKAALNEYHFRKQAQEWVKYGWRILFFQPRSHVEVRSDFPPFYIGKNVVRGPHSIDGST